jgi:hypothetical protein
MLSSLLNVMFGCAHRNTTFPMTPRRRKSGRNGESYVVCLVCGTEFQYDWMEMRIRKTPKTMAPVTVQEEQLQACTVRK